MPMGVHTFPFFRGILIFYDKNDGNTLLTIVTIDIPTLSEDFYIAAMVLKVKNELSEGTMTMLQENKQTKF